MPELYENHKAGSKKVLEGWLEGRASEAVTSGSGRDYSRRNRVLREEIKPRPIKKQS